MREENVTETTEKQENAYYSAKPNFAKQGTSKIRKMFDRGATAFLVVAASIVFYFALLRLTNVRITFGKVYDVLKPVIYGCVIAYLLTPLVKKVDKYMIPFLEERMDDKKKIKKISRGTGITVSLILLFTIIVLLCNLLIPELYNSIKTLVVTLPNQLNYTLYRINNFQFSDSTTTSILKTLLEEGTAMFQNWLRTDFMEQVNQVMSNLTEGVLNIFGELFDMLIGVIVSVYIMFGRENFSRQCKKSVYAVFSPRHANMILHLTTKSNEIFGGFIIGKIIDSAIIGVLCFICLSILNMPYTVLVSVIVGVTNVIPFFGPFIGAIPSAILIIVNDPIKGLYFIIFILLLQQFDGNILGPKILGNSTGLSSFWVIVAILLGGGLFGFAGMLMGVPTFAVIYYVVDMLLNDKLEKKNLPTNSRHYNPMSYVDEYGQFRYTHVHKERTTKEEVSKDEKKDETEEKE